MKIIFLIIPFLLISCAKPKVKDGDAGTDTATKTESSSDSSASESSMPSADSASERATCVSGKDERTLFLSKNDAGGCDVVYTKWGESNVIGSAKNDHSFCTKVFGNVKSNLETAGFQCQ